MLHLFLLVPTTAFGSLLGQALRTISIDFLLNLVSNLRRLGIEHFFILTTRKLCAMLQAQHCLYACGWTTLWDDHAGLSTWGIRPGDMFLMWAQQWRYVARAMEMGYSVLRTDTDVYFAEDPYPLLHSRLLRPFSLIVQQDFGGPLGGRPVCRQIVRHAHDAASYATAADHGGELPAIASCGVHRGTALLNIGLVSVGRSHREPTRHASASQASLRLLLSSARI